MAEKQDQAERIAEAIMAGFRDLAERIAGGEMVGGHENLAIPLNELAQNVGAVAVALEHIADAIQEKD